MKKMLAIILSMVMISTVVISINIGADAYAVPAAEKDQWNLSAANYVKNIKSGWNLGNTLEDVCLEGYFGTYIKNNGISFNNWSSWYNCEFDGYPVDIYNNKITDPKIWESEMSYSQSTVTTKALIDKVHDAGFNAIRIPVTWFNWSNYNSGNFTLPNGVECTGDKLSPEIIDRVKQIIDWACEDNMYVILNMHHDDGIWLHADQDLSTEEGRTRWSYIKTRYENFWKQIAYYFRDYGSNVVFAGMNEIVSGAVSQNWSADPCSYFNNNMQELYQIFVDTVRSSGGNNAKRYLAISPWGAQINRVLLLPSDPKSDGGVNRLIIEIHIYNEWTYANPGINFAGQFDMWQSKYMNNGYGVIIGEGAFTDDTSDDNNRTASVQLAYAASKIYGIPFFQWDNGGIGGTKSAKYRLVSNGAAWCMLKRSDLTWRYPKQLKAMMDSTYLFNSDCPTATVRNKCYYQTAQNNGAFYFDFSGDNLLENVTWRQGKYNADGTVDTQANNSIYAEKINVTPGQTYEIRNNSYYGINEIYKLNVYGYDSSGNKISLGKGQKTKFLWYYVDTKKTQSSLGETVDFDSEMNTDAKITIPNNITSIAISATASRATTNSSQLLGLINSGIFIPQVRQYASETMSIKSGNGTVNEFSTINDSNKPIEPNTTVTSSTSGSTSGGSESTNKYLYIKSLKGDGTQNFRFTFGESGIPSNAKKFVVSTKGNGSAGLEMAFRATVDASYTDDTSSRIALNGTTDWVTNEIDLTANDYSKYYSVLIYVPSNSEISIDNVGFILEDGSFKAIQDFESLIAGTKQSGLLNIVNDAEILAKFGFSGTKGWDFNGEFEIKSENVNTTQPSSPSESEYKVTIDGSKIEYSGYTVTLPVSTKKGFIAYTDGTNYYDENSQVPVLSDINFTTISIGSVTMLNGASIRLGKVSGMRFHTVVEPDVLATLPQNAVIEKGTLITPKDLLGSEDLTLDASCQILNIPYTSNKYYENNNTFVGSIVEIKKTNITRDFIGRGYVKVTLGNYSKTVYANYADNNIANNTRSIAYIANVYSQSEEYASLRTDLKEIVDVWASQYKPKSEDKLLIEWKNANNFYTPLSSYSTDDNGFNINDNSSSGTDLIGSWANNTVGYDGIKFKLNIKADNELNVMGIYVTGNYYKWMAIPSTSGEIEVVIPFSELDTWTGEVFTPGESQDIKFAKNNDFNGKIDITIGNIYLYKNS